MKVTDEGLKELINRGKNGAGNFGTHYTDNYIVPALEELQSYRKRD